MASLDETALKNVAKTLRHAGRKLLKVHSVDKLLQQLDKLELSLSILHQEPTEIIQESLVPVTKALISDELLKHTEEDVKISVTSCITQITRITAPDVPYDDEQMKEIFKLVVVSFEKLSDISGRGYEKALAILDNVNMVRLCLVMLDLECDDLVIEMFHHFLTFIRSHHSHNTIHSMESIMTLVLQESEQISLDLLRLLLDSVESKNQIFSSISCLLGEKVMRNCAVTLKPHLMKAVELSGRALDDYAFIVRDICTNGSKSPECHSANSSKKKKSVEEPKLKNQLNHVPRKRSRKPNSLMNAKEGYDHSWIYRETNPGKSAPSRKAHNCSSAFPSSEKPNSRKDKLDRKHKPAIETLGSEPISENMAKSAQSRRNHNIGNEFPSNDNPVYIKDAVLSKPEDTSEGLEVLTSKRKTKKHTDAASSLNNNISGVRSNSASVSKEDNLNPPLDSTSLGSPVVKLEEESKVRKDSEQKHIRKIKFSVKFGGKIAVVHESVVVEPTVSCGGEGKHKSSDNTVPENMEEGRLSAPTDVQKRRKLNPAPNKGLNKSSAVKEMISEFASKTFSRVKETAQRRPRRRHIPASESCDQDNSLVGRRIKVWWPLDKMFYEGVIDSYYANKGTHKILYTDGEVEVLNLKKERWELVAIDVSLDEEGNALQKLAEASDMAEKGQEIPEFESAKGANTNSRSRRGRTSARNSKSVDRSNFLDDSPITAGRRGSARKTTNKRMKTGSDTKKNKRVTSDDLE